MGFEPQNPLLAGKEDDFSVCFTYKKTLYNVSYNKKLRSKTLPNIVTSHCQNKNASHLNILQRQLARSCILAMSPYQGYHPENQVVSS